MNGMGWNRIVLPTRAAHGGNSYGSAVGPSPANPLHSSHLRAWAVNVLVARRPMMMVLDFRPDLLLAQHADRCSGVSDWTPGGVKRALPSIDVVLSQLEFSSPDNFAVATFARIDRRPMNGRVIPHVMTAPWDAFGRKDPHCCEANRPFD